MLFLLEKYCTASQLLLCQNFLQKFRPSMVQRTGVSQSRRKMRKSQFTADRSRVRIIMSSRLSKDLRSTYGFKSFPVRTGDTVIVTTGKFKSKEGKVLSVSRKTKKVTVDGCTNIKASGGTVNYPIDASNLIIKSLMLDDCRSKALENKKQKTERLRERRAALTAN